MKNFTKSLFAIVALMALLLPSCSGNETADAGELLGTIPNDASVVAVINVKSILEKSGCKVADDKVTLSPELKALAEKQGGVKGMENVSALCDGETGVDPTVMAIYKVGYYTYLTGYLADPEKFKDYMGKKNGVAFASENGIDISANIAVSNSRFWINLEQGSVDPNEIKHFTALDNSQSFLDNEYSSKMSEFTTDIEGWGNINGLLNTANLPFQGRAGAQVAIQTIFEDPSAITFSVDFRKGMVDMSMGFLNAKGKPAKFQFPTDKIDVDAVSSIGGNAEILFAVALPSKLISKLTKEASSKGPSMLGEYLKLVQPLDGTTAVAYSTEKGAGIRGIVTTDGKDLTPLTSMIGQLGVNVNKDGNVLRLSEGEMAGKLVVSDAGKELKGAMLGAVVSTALSGDLGKSGIDRAVITLVPEDGSLRLKISGVAADDKENILQTVIKNQ